MAANVKVDFDPVPPSLAVNYKEVIGQGSHCVVYRGELDSKPVVVKKIHEDLLNFVDFHKFKEDCDRMKNVRHPNVIKFVGVYREKRTPILVTELMQEDLDTYLKRNRGKLPAERSSAICCSVCEGLAYLHKSNIPVTLSSEKIFLNKQGEVKLAYFDLSNLLKKDSRKATGSGVHVHPKATRGIQVPATAVDSYSLIVFLLKICTQQPLSPGVDPADTGARQHEHDLKQLEDTHPFKPIIVWCLQHKTLPPSVDVVYHHVSTISDYFKKIDDLKSQKIVHKDMLDMISKGYIQVKHELELARKQIVSLERGRNLLKKESDKYTPTQLVVNPLDDHMKCAPVPEKPIMKDHSLAPELLPAPAVNTIKYYIAVEDIPFPKENHKPVSRTVVYYAEKAEIQNKQTCISRGELLVSEGASTGDPITARLAFDTSQQFTCSKSSVVPVTAEEYQLLAPIKCLPDRLALSKNKDALSALAKLKVEDRVWVTIPPELDSPSISEGTASCAAIIKYIGEIEGEVGRYFGVQIEEPLGDCKMTFKDSQYFVSDKNHHRLFPASQLDVTSKPPETPHRQEVHVTLSESVYGHEFNEGEEVNIVGKDGRRTAGKVKWTSLSATARKRSHIKMEDEESSTSGQDQPELDISEVDVTVVPEVTPPCPPHRPTTVQEETQSPTLPEPTTTVPEETQPHSSQPITTVPEETQYPSLPETLEYYTADEEEVTPEGSLSHSPLLPSPQPASHPFTVGSLVMVPVGRKEVCGTIRWIGEVPSSDEQMAGIELDVRHRSCGSGDYEGVTYFECDKGHGKFVPVSKLRPDPRFVEEPQGRNPVEIELLGKCEVIAKPVDCPKESDLPKFIGVKRGIQGHHNSCYVDSTLFAMYGLTSVFDDLILEEPQEGATIGSIVKRMSREIIYPLRRNGVVRFEPVMELRRALDRLNQLKGLTYAEQDPEEFMNLLFKHIFKMSCKPFIKLQRPSGTDTEFFLQLFVEKSEKTLFTMKEMLFQCMKEQNITFVEVPQRLIIQLPRYGKDFKVYERIYPELHMDVSDICVDGIPHKKACSICKEEPSKYYCSDHGHESHDPPGQVRYLCADCELTVYQNIAVTKKNEACNFQRLSVTLDLLSVVCIEKSHYVCFSRHGSRWFFFDSMADRTDDGFNIPCVQECPEIGEGLKDTELLRKKPPSSLPPLLRRLVNDAYICIYVDPNVGMTP